MHGDAQVSHCDGVWSWVWSEALWNSLSHCEIKDKGMVCISRGLKQNKTLAVLK